MAHPEQQFFPVGMLVARRYQLTEVLGMGGAGTTYAATDRWSGARVALKLVGETLSGQLDTLRHEFSILRQLLHPHLVRVLDFQRTSLGSDSRHAFLTEELVQGRTLAEALSGAAPPAWAEMRRVLVDTLRALRLLHAAGIRHGDFTPANVMVRPDGSGVLIDLSCAAVVRQSTTSIAGTRGFLAPELLNGTAADHRADLYAVGSLCSPFWAELATRSINPVMIWQGV